MANEPNRAEEELKRYAAARRAQAPTELHAADRRLLQGEVARVYGKRGEEAAWWKRVLLAPRFAWGVSLMAIFGISFLALQKQAPRQAMNAASAVKELDQNLAQRPEGVEAQRDEKKEKSVEASAAPENVIVTASKPVSAPAAVAPPAIMLEPAGEVRLQKMVEAPKRVEPEKLLATAAPKNEMYFLNSAPQTQVKDRTDAAAASQVLNRFRFQESGRLLVVVDSDGSSYSGATLSQQSGTNTFLVSGTNRTLNQRVEFRGRYFRMAPQQLQFQQNQNQTRQAQEQLAREQVRVQGQAVVGNNNQVQVDAQAPSQ